MWTAVGDALGDTNGLLDAGLMNKRVVGPQLPARVQRSLELFAQDEGPRLTRYLNYTSVALLWFILHQGLHVHTKSPGSPLTTCPVHNWPTLAVIMVLLAVRIGVVVLNGIGAVLPLPVVLARDVLLILSGVYISSTALTSSFDSQSSVLDVCGAITNSVAGFAMFYGVRPRSHTSKLSRPVEFLATRQWSYR